MYIYIYIYIYIYNILSKLLPLVWVCGPGLLRQYTNVMEFDIDYNNYVIIKLNLYGDNSVQFSTFNTEI